MYNLFSYIIIRLSKMHLSHVSAVLKFEFKKSTRDGVRRNFKVLLANVTFTD